MNVQLELWPVAEPPSCLVCGEDLVGIDEEGVCHPCAHDIAKFRALRQGRLLHPPSHQPDLSTPLPGLELVALFRHVYQTLEQELVGNTQAKRVLALELVRHVATAPRMAPRLLVAGETGKSALVHAAWQALPTERRPPLELVPAGMATADGWGAAANIAGILDTVLHPHAIVVLDNVQEVAIGQFGGDSVARSHYQLVWRSLGRAVRGEVLRSEHGKSVDSAGHMVIVTLGRPDGVPEALPAFQRMLDGHAPDPGSLELFGVPQSVAGVLASRHIVVTEPCQDDLATILSRWPEASDLAELARSLGIATHVSPTAVAVLAQAVWQAGRGLTLRDAGSMLAAALRTALLDRLTAGDLETPVVIGPDDILPLVPSSH